MSTPTRHAGPSGRLAPRSSRQPAARHFDVPPARLEPLTRHASYGAAELARMEYQAENDAAGIREEIRTMAVPGHPTDWMLVAIAPPLFAVHPTLGPVTADELAKADDRLRKRLLVSFSGGETSGMMALWCRENLADEYDMTFVFANTGEEREETLAFVERVDRHFGLGVVWVEAVVHHGERKGCTHRVVDYATASRNGEPFEAVIQKYGIPNQSFPHCTRELKTNPITSYVRDDLGWVDYYTAIGIRADEADRVDAAFREKRFLYPLIQHRPTTKPEVNAFWDGQPFRLPLKGYQGNCKACWKKSLRKLMTIAIEEPGAFDNVAKWERAYGDFTPPSRSENSQPPYRFFRKGRSAADVISQARCGRFTPAHNDATVLDYQLRLFGAPDELDKVAGGCDDHCEPFNVAP